jgi:hypothetical protein
MQGKRKDGMGNFRSGSAILPFSEVHLTRGSGKPKEGMAEMIAEL